MYPHVALCSKGRLLALPTDVRLGWKWLIVTDTLALFLIIGNIPFIFGSMGSVFTTNDDLNDKLFISF